VVEYPLGKRSARLCMVPGCVENMFHLCYPRLTITRGSSGSIVGKDIIFVLGDGLGAQCSVLRVNEPKKAGARSAWACSAACH
jgi:hypothetical protein